MSTTRPSYQFDRLPKDAAKDKRLSSVDYHILGYLCSCVNQEGRCWPRQETIAEHVGKNREWVNRRIRHMQKLGYLVVEKDGNKNIYVINYVSPSSQCVAQDTKNDENYVSSTTHSAPDDTLYVSPTTQHSVRSTTHSLYKDEQESVEQEPRTIPPLAPPGGDPPDLVLEPVKNHSPDKPKPKTRSPASPEDDPLWEDFAEIWPHYPKQRIGNKTKAFQAFKRALTEKRSTKNEILQGVMRYAASSEVERGFAKGFAAWLNDDRWQQEFREPTPNPQKSGHGSGGSYFDMLRNAAVGAAENVHDQRVYRQ